MPVLFLSQYSQSHGMTKVPAEEFAGNSEIPYIIYPFW
jgi:hypothetical protein